MTDLQKTPRTTLRRRAQRGSYDRQLAYAILDEALVCHVGFVHEGQPLVLPMAYARDDDTLLLHGAAGNHMLRLLTGGAPLCVTVTLIDGLVLARSAFHHSMNYRSLMLFGHAAAITEPQAKRRAMVALVEHVARGRSADVRPSSDAELQGTAVLSLRIDEGSIKARSGPPVDDVADLALSCWAGVVPTTLRPGIPLPSPDLPSSIPLPSYLQPYRRNDAYSPGD